MLRLLFLSDVSGAALDRVSFPGFFPVLVPGRNLRVLFQTWWLEFCNCLAWGMAEVLLRHSWLSNLQLRKRTCKSSFRCWGVFFFKFFFFIYFLLLLNNLWPDGRQTQCNVQKQEHSFNFHLQFPGCRADSWVTLSVLELISLGFTLREIYLAGAKPSYIS